MELLLARAIEAEARKRLARHSRNRYYANKYRSSFEKRTGLSATVPAAAVPAQWNYHKQFDPRYCINHSKFLARGVWTALRSGSYAPVPSYRISIPKPSGGLREIDSFSVTDAAVAKIFYNNLRSRNAKIFSDSSYAYQKDKTPLDAILRLKDALAGPTVFISQYDFTKYFDSISHAHLETLLSDGGPFLTTHMERMVLRALMKHPYQRASRILRRVPRRNLGVPQGNSLSLFLSNVAAHPLDAELGRLNGAFARFADDSVIVNYSYEDALRCAEVYREFSDASGVAINDYKSTGIRLFRSNDGEMRHIDQFCFLSYSFRPDGLYVGDNAVRQMKRRCIKIIYNHLLLHIRRTGTFNTARRGRGFVDWDLVTCVNELRGYIYGGISQAQINRYLDDNVNIRSLKGAPSYFCLVDSGDIFRELDGWLTHALYLAYKSRIRILNRLVPRARYVPLSKESLINGTWYRFSAVKVEARLPSFFTSWRAARKSWKRHGLGGVDVTGSGYAYGE